MNPLLLLLLAAGGIAAAASSSPSKTSDKPISGGADPGGSGGVPKSLVGGSDPCSAGAAAYAQAVKVMAQAVQTMDRALAEKALTAANFARQSLALVGCQVPPAMTLPPAFGSGAPSPAKPAPAPAPAPGSYTPAKPSGKVPPPPQGWTENNAPDYSKATDNAAFCAKKQKELDAAGAAAAAAQKAGDMKLAASWAVKATGILAQMKNSGCTPVIPAGLVAKKPSGGAAEPPKAGCDLAQTIFRTAVAAAQTRLGEKNLVAAQSAVTTAQGAIQTAAGLGCPIDSAPLAAILAALGQAPSPSTPAGAITNCTDAQTFFSGALGAAQKAMGQNNLVGAKSAADQATSILAAAKALGCTIDAAPLSTILSQLGAKGAGLPALPGAGGLPGVPSPVVASTHTIVYGDTPTGLSKKYTGVTTRWRELGAANPGLGALRTTNGITNYANWRPGFVLTLPPGWAGLPPNPMPPPPPGPVALPAVPGSGGVAVPSYPLPGASAGSTTPNSGVAGLPMSFPIRYGDIPVGLASYYTGDTLRWRELKTANPSLGATRPDGSIPGWNVGAIITIPAAWNPGLKPLPPKKG